MNNKIIPLEELTKEQFIEIASDQECLDTLLKYNNDDLTLEDMYINPKVSSENNEEWRIYAGKAMVRDSLSNYGTKPDRIDTPNTMYTYSHQIAEKSISAKTVEKIYNSCIETLKTCDPIVCPTLIRWMKCFPKYYAYYGTILLNTDNEKEALIYRIIEENHKRIEVSDLIELETRKAISDLIASIYQEKSDFDLSKIP